MLSLFSLLKIREMDTVIEKNKGKQGEKHIGNPL